MAHDAGGERSWREAVDARIHASIELEEAIRAATGAGEGKCDVDGGCAVVRS